MTDRYPLKFICFLMYFAVAACPFSLYGQDTTGTSAARQEQLAISGVKVIPNAFNPSKGQATTIYYHCTRPAKVSVRIFDLQLMLVRELLTDSPGGWSSVEWDGKDEKGRVAPDEAYFPTIEAADFKGGLAFYDPTVTTGGELFVPDNLAYDPEARLVRYRLARDARINIRVGVASGGPLLRNIVCAAPREAGWHEEPWDGRDESGSIDLTGGRDFKLAAEAVSLPESTIFTTGNEAYDYFQYVALASADGERLKKIERPLFQREKQPQNEQYMQQQGLRPVQLDPEPRFHIELPASSGKTPEGLPIVGGKARVRISLDEKVKPLMAGMRYEILFFVDNKFVTEMEEGHSPFNLLWDTTELPDGEHVITVNIATITGQLSAGSMRVYVDN